jgi:hypothetical protein
MPSRKTWIGGRQQELSANLDISVDGFSVMDTHLPLLVRLDPTLGQGWSDEEVVRRRGRLFPPRQKARQDLTVIED